MSTNTYNIQDSCAVSVGFGPSLSSLPKISKMNNFNFEYHIKKIGLDQFQ